MKQALAQALSLARLPFVHVAKGTHELAQSWCGRHLMLPGQVVRARAKQVASSMCQPCVVGTLTVLRDSKVGTMALLGRAMGMGSGVQPEVPCLSLLSIARAILCRLGRY